MLDPGRGIDEMAGRIVDEVQLIVLSIPTGHQGAATTPAEPRPIAIEIDFNGQARRYRLQHGDHFDTLSTHNTWTCEDEDGNPLDWYGQWVREGCESQSLEEILARRPRTAKYTQRLAASTISNSLTRRDLVEFFTSWEYATYIPLFSDPETGDEYQIDLGNNPELPRLTCPSVHAEKNVPPANPLFLLHTRGVPPSAAPQELQPRPQQRKPPRYAIQLGTLRVRTATFRGLQLRFSSDDEPPEPTTETTDWNVILDAEDENLSMWVVASRQQLKDHIMVLSEEYDEPMLPLPLPIFSGYMSDETADYDCACILDSVRRLHVGTDNNWRESEFRKALETIRNTRCIADPVMSSLPEEQLDRFASGEAFNHETPVTWPADPDLEVKIAARLLADGPGEADEEP